MTANEFKSRTEKFLSAEEISRYEEWYEPAYMAAAQIDKDDFCKMLKDPVARKFVLEMSCAVLDHRDQLKSMEEQHKVLRGLQYDAEQAAAKYRKAILLISATCDRTGATA